MASLIKRKKKKKKEKTDKKGPGSEPKLTGKKLFDAFDEDDKVHQLWETETQPTLAYRYFATNQLPSKAEQDEVGLGNFWVQINRIREAHKTRMGILTNSPIKWTVTGRGSDSSDRLRVNMVLNAMRWMGSESGLFPELLRTLDDFSLIGMAWLRVRFDRYFRTMMDTIGMTVPERLDPRLCYADGAARKASLLDGNRSSYINRVTKERFRYQWGERYLADGKKLDIDKIFRDIQDSKHPDFKLNDGRPEREKEITIVEMEYRRTIYKRQELGDGDLIVPVPEYRLALGAGYEKIQDEVSPINDLEMYQKIVFQNDPMADLPYSSSDFQAEKELQDLLNIMASMTIDNQARQMNSPWLVYDGSIVSEKYWKTNSSRSAAILKWKYTDDMLASGVPLDAARPSRLHPGQVGGDWLAMQEYVARSFDRVSIDPVARGENPRGVTSGKQAEILSENAQQPTFYVKQKLEAPLRRVGQIFYHHAKKHFLDEMELPVEEESIGAESGIVVNRTIDLEERLLLEKGLAEFGEKFIEQPEIRMISVRRGAERLSLVDWLNSGGKPVDMSVQLVENDLTFGNFNVGLTIDPKAEVSKQLQREQAQTLASVIMNIGAPRTGLKHLLEANDTPGRQQLMKDIDEEIAQNREAEAQAQQGPVDPTAQQGQ